MASLNKVSIIGRVGQEPKIAYTSDGKAIAKISLACSETWKDKSGQKQEKTEWIPVSIFGKLAEIVQAYVHTGSQLYIEGKYTTRKWQNKEGQDQWTTEVILSGFGGVLQMLDSKGEGQPKQEHVPTVREPIEPVAEVGGFVDSEIPFAPVHSALMV
jgi:single-strand DNA-binding protein